MDAFQMAGKIRRRLRAGALAVCVTLAGCVPNPFTGGDGGGGGGGQAARDIPDLVVPLRTHPRAAEDVSFTSLLLSWTVVPGATQYEVYLGVDTNPPLVAKTTQANHYIRDLPACTVHYWRVVALNDNEAVSSATWSFKTRCP